MLVNPDLITVTGRVLPEPRITYKYDEDPKVQRGTWNMQAMEVTQGGILRNWTHLVIYKAGSSNKGVISEAELKFTVGKFHRTLRDIGIIADPPFAGSTIRVDSPDDIKIEAELRRIASSKNNPARFVLVILPEVESRMYNRVKHAGDVKVGIHTVCVVGSKFAQADRQQVQKFANVGLKFNLKLGGINQLADSKGLDIIKEDKTMVVGVDVTHPSPGSAPNAPSVAGMVASVDRWLGQWPADLRIQEPRKEMVSELDSMLESRLKLWKSQGDHAAFPENVLVYRDGVSEGQYAMVLEAELPLLRKACDNLYPVLDRKKGLPHITIVIVGKRHHTRFYGEAVFEAGSGNCNPVCGTVVDRGVTEARNWDFFLQSHKGVQGTARPAHYYVVLDEIFAKRKIPPQFHNVADVLEDLTLSMCYLFGRATKSVSVCPPAYYADIVCERARCYLSGIFDMAIPSGTSAPSEAAGGGHPEARTEDLLIHPNLKNTMFYI